MQGSERAVKGSERQRKAAKGSKAVPYLHRSHLGSLLRRELFEPRTPVSLQLQQKLSTGTAAVSRDDECSSRDDEEPMPGDEFSAECVCVLIWGVRGWEVCVGEATSTPLS